MSLITNHKASFNYEILEKYVAGIELFGFEVKSLKKAQGSLEGAYVITKGNEVYITGMFIPPYQPSNTPKDYNPYRDRRLLLKREEIMALQKNEKTKRLTITPISVYNKGGLVKLDIAVVRGKKRFDKRETIKKRDTDRDLDREYKAR